MLFRRTIGAMALVLLLGAIMVPDGVLAATGFVSSVEQLQPTSPTANGMYSYIVRLDDEPLAIYDGGIEGFAATSPAVTGIALQQMLRSDAGQAYQQYLADRRQDLLADIEETLGRTVRLMHEYDLVFNGMTLLLSPAEAKQVARLDGVKSVRRDQVRQRQTDDVPERTLDARVDSDADTTRSDRDEMSNRPSRPEAPSRTSCPSHR